MSIQQLKQMTWLYGWLVKQQQAGIGLHEFTSWVFISSVIFVLHTSSASVTLEWQTYISHACFKSSHYHHHIIYSIDWIKVYIGLTIRTMSGSWN